MPKGHPDKTPGSGRKKGTKNKFTLQQLREAAEQVLKLSSKSGMTPMSFLYYTMMNEYKNLGELSEIPFSLRFKAAVTICQYIHPRVQNVNHKVDSSTDSNERLSEYSNEELVQMKKAMQDDE